MAAPAWRAGARAAFIRPKIGAGEKSVDSWWILFYDLLVDYAQGGDPGVSVALVYTAEILK